MLNFVKPEHVGTKCYYKKASFTKFSSQLQLLSKSQNCLQYFYLHFYLQLQKYQLYTDIFIMISFKGRNKGKNFYQTSIYQFAKASVSITASNLIFLFLAVLLDFTSADSYHFSQIFRTSFNIIWKKDFCHELSFFNGYIIKQLYLAINTKISHQLTT